MHFGIIINLFQVRMRALVLDSTLKPSSKISQVDEIFVKDKAGNRIAQWKNVTLNTGMAQVTMKLDEEPILVG